MVGSRSTATRTACVVALLMGFCATARAEWRFAVDAAQSLAVAFVEEGGALAFGFACVRPAPGGMSRVGVYGPRDAAEAAIRVDDVALPPFVRGNASSFQQIELTDPRLAALRSGRTAALGGRALPLAGSSLAIGALQLYCGEPESANAAGPKAPSFACRPGLRPAETTICSDSGLARLDRDLLIAYARAVGVTTSETRRDLLARQSAWISRRNACSDAPCIERAYRDQLSWLQGSFRDVDAAGAAARAASPGAGPTAQPAPPIMPAQPSDRPRSETQREPPAAAAPAPRAPPPAPARPLDAGAVLSPEFLNQPPQPWSPSGAPPPLETSGLVHAGFYQAIHGGRFTAARSLISDPALVRRMLFELILAHGFLIDLAGSDCAWPTDLDGFTLVTWSQRGGERIGERRLRLQFPPHFRETVRAADAEHDASRTTAQGRRFGSGPLEARADPIFRDMNTLVIAQGCRAPATALLRENLLRFAKDEPPADLREMARLYPSVTRSPLWRGTPGYEFPADWRPLVRACMTSFRSSTRSAYDTAWYCACLDVSLREAAARDAHAALSADFDRGLSVWYADPTVSAQQFRCAQWRNTAPEITQRARELVPR